MHTDTLIVRSPRHPPARVRHLRRKRSLVHVQVGPPDHAPGQRPSVDSVAPALLTNRVTVCRSNPRPLSRGSSGCPSGTQVVRVVCHPRGMGQSPSAEHFDQWYANMAARGRREEIVQRHLGLPARLLSTSLLAWDGIAEIVDVLRLQPGARLLDLACGRAGYGLEIAERTGARLIGVDFSAEAVREAAWNARRFRATAEFQVGELAATGLPSASVDAVVCVDAIQFDARPESFAEIRRVIVPGGRVVLTTWEPLDRDDERVLDRIRAVDTRAGLASAGFADVDVRERTEWRAAERAMWCEAAVLDPGDDRGLQSLHDEGRRVLEQFDLVRRVLATATTP